ncbi:MAG TPA: ferritin-like domain-containing protein, partial [Polyangiaceae bacterium]
RFACQTPADTCMTATDCTGGYCNSDDVRTCQTPTITGTGGSCGRPFLVAGHARLAAVRSVEGGWSRRSGLDATGLSERARRTLAKYWTEAGRMEHASVAAFARFALELLALGAPAELVVGAQQAMGDEIEHARLCFGLAAGYAETPVGPAALSIDGALDARSFEAIVTTAMLEACVGETLAAIEAEEALADAREPEVRRALERIARDEAKHAELGFRFLGWALKRAAPELRARLVAELGGALRTLFEEPAELAQSDETELAGHGLLSNSRRRALRRLAIRQIIEPALAGLSGSAPERCSPGWFRSEIS